MNEPTYFLLSAVAVLISLTVHEFSHAFVSAKQGDPTAAYCGRLTLNPMRHIDPLGAIAMLLFRIGWAKPVPIDPRYYKHPRRGMALTAIAGPISNVLLSFLSAPLFLISFKAYDAALLSHSVNGLPLSVLYNLTLFLHIFHILNLSLAIFNLLPITPLDGSRLLYLVLPPRPYRWLVRHERQIYFAVLAWLILGDRLFEMLMRMEAFASSVPLTVLASLFAPSVWISIATEAISALMLRFWTLLPFLG